MTSAKETEGDICGLWFVAIISQDPCRCALCEINIRWNKTATLLFSLPILRCARKGLFLSYSVHTFARSRVSEALLLCQDNNPPGRCLQSCWLKCRIVAQVCRGVCTTKGHAKLCRFITRHNAADSTAGMSTITVNWMLILHLKKRVQCVTF